MSFQLTYYPKINEFLASHPDFDDEDPVEPDFGGWVVKVNESGGTIYGWNTGAEGNSIESFYMNEMHVFDGPVAFAEWANKTDGEIETGVKMSPELVDWHRRYDAFSEACINELSKTTSALEKRGYEEFKLEKEDVEGIIARSWDYL